MTRPEATIDPEVQRFRDEITALDLELVRLVNRRLETVIELRRYKEEQGIPFLDPEREESMRRYLVGANRGPLSAEGLTQLYSFLLDLIKREVGG